MKNFIGLFTAMAMSTMPREALTRGKRIKRNAFTKKEWRKLKKKRKQVKASRKRNRK